MDVGRRLRELRLSRNLSLYDVEARTGLHFSTVGKYERGERRPGVAALRALAALYGVSVAELLGEPPARPELPDDLAAALAERPELVRLVGAARRLRPGQAAALAELLRRLVPPEPPHRRGRV